MKNEKNMETLRLYPRKIKEYFRMTNSRKTVPIPAKILEQLGFGNMEELTKLINDKKLNGTIDENDDSKTMIYVKGDKDVKTIMLLRSANPNIVTIPKLANMLGVEKNIVKNAICKGQIDAISGFVFRSDASQTRIDISNPKNAKFIKNFASEN